MKQQLTVKHFWIWPIVGVGLVLLAFALASGTDPAPIVEPVPSSALDDGRVSGTRVELGSAFRRQGVGLRVRLSQGEASASNASAALKRVDGRPLSEPEIDAVTNRLPAWDGDRDGDTAEFNRPAETFPPPRTGATINNPFAPASDSEVPVVASGPLQVLRVQPRGEVGIAPFLSVTFSQPMVPLATVSQLDLADVPLTLTPSLPGRWQWIGTRTLRFEHDPEVFDRLPMATSYVVEVPAGTTSQSGGELADTVRFSFETPAPIVLSFTPQHDSLNLEPVFLATFDQRIDPGAVLETITVTANGTEQAIRLANDAEIAADEQIRQLLGTTLDGTWVAFRAVTKLAPDAAIRIQVGPHVPSAEGTKTSAAPFVVEARTYADLTIDGMNCLSGRPCEPGSSLDAYFNNVLDPTTLNVDDIKITPELAGARISVDYSSLRIVGQTVGDTTYEVVIPSSLSDEFGQTLGEPQTVDFHVGSARPFISDFGRLFVTLDPLVEQQTMPLIVRNHERLRVRIYDVDTDDFGSFRSFIYRWERSRGGKLPEAPWTLVSDAVVDTRADANAVTEVRIDLGDALKGDHGHVIVIVEGVGRYAELTYSDDDYWNNRPVIAWVQDTNIGVDMIAHNRRVVAWATDLRSGDPLADVEINLQGHNKTISTDNSGLARAEIAGEHGWVVATSGNDQAINPAPVVAQSRNNRLIWYTVDDRGIYRPAETVHLKGWVRKLDLLGDGDLEFLADQQVVTYKATDWHGNELAQGSFRLDEHGGFDLAFALPDGVNLGEAWIELKGPQRRDNSVHFHSFQIQEFRRPEFEVSARLESAGPYFRDEPATVAVDAKYFSGGPLPNAEVSWVVTTRRASFAPPNWNEFTFGVWTPWWNDNAFAGSYYDDYAPEVHYPGERPEMPVRETFTGSTDSSGSHYLRMDFAGNGDDLPTTVTAEAQVTDVNRQQWASSTDVLVHAGENYVGIRSDRSFVKAGDGLDISAIVTDVDGNPVVGRVVEMIAARVVDEYVDGQWIEVAVDPEECEVTSLAEPVQCEFEAAVGGRYRIDAAVVDDAGRTNRSELTRWVSGASDSVRSRNVELETANLIPDAQAYAAGDTAEILVDSPFRAATGLLVIAHNEIIETRTFEISDHSAVLEIPISDDYVPELTVQVEIVATTPRTADDGRILADIADRPAFASGQIRLRVPPARRTLRVVATPASSVAQPGASTSVAVEVTDANGEPVENADVLLVVVDEAVLALSDYKLTDPLEVFYQSEVVDLIAERARASVLLANPQQILDLSGVDAGEPTTDATAASGMADDMADESADFDDSSLADGPVEQRSFSAEGLQVAVRANLDALALFDPEVATDANGVATVDFDLPDNLTRYRIMAIAVEGTERFGSTESSITARLPIQVRPSAPRFLNFGDTFALPVVVQNLTGSVAEVDVVLQTSNLNLHGPAGRRITIPANDRVEVSFQASTKLAGIARFRVAAVSADEVDAQVVSLPVYTPATSEAFASYGTLESGVVSYSLDAPQDVFPKFGGLEINTSSTALQALTDAVLYLAEYRFASSDAYASRILAISSLRDVLGAFEAEGLGTPAELDSTVRSDILALTALQHSDGGFGWWARKGISYPYPSIQAMHALITAKREGFEVADQVIASGSDYLRDIENRIPDDYSQKAKDMLLAYALHVRALNDDFDASAARALWKRRGTSLEADALAWIWPVVGDANIEAEISRALHNRVTETAQSASVVTSYDEGAYLILASDRRTDGIVLNALIDMAPESDLIPKVVAGLLANRIKGRWGNIQENSFILLALNRYFETFEAVEPDFIARVWLGDQYIAQHDFSGRSIDRVSTLVPMMELLEASDTDSSDTKLIVQNDGDGRLYYRLGLRYAPADLNLEPLDRGFVVQRSYQAINDPDDVWVDSTGTVHVRAGAEVRVELTMVNDSGRTNMVLLDPLPAGFEILNPALAVTGEIARPHGLGDAEANWWHRTWYNHQNLRDDRAEAFSSYLWPGTHQYSYVVRATTPGTFVVPPARAEEIYAPEVFGRSGSDTVVVKD